MHCWKSAFWDCCSNKLQQQQQLLERDGVLLMSGLLSPNTAVPNEWYTRTWHHCSASLRLYGISCPSSVKHAVHRALVTNEGTTRHLHGVKMLISLLFARAVGQMSHRFSGLLSTCRPRVVRCPRFCKYAPKQMAATKQALTFESFGRCYQI